MPGAYIKFGQFQDEEMFATEQDDMFEGDIKLTRAQKLEMSSPVALHNAKRDGHWKKYGLGVVPYSLTGNFTWSQKLLIEEAFKEYHDKTCIRFVPKTTQNPHLTILRDDDGGCWSHVGYIGGNQQNNEINLAKKCFKDGHGT